MRLVLGLGTFAPGGRQERIQAVWMRIERSGLGCLDRELRYKLLYQLG